MDGQTCIDSSETSENELLDAVGGRPKEAFNKKESGKQLNTILEEHQKDIETKEKESPDEEETEEMNAASFEANEDKIALTVKRSIPKIMISKDRIAV